MSPPQVQEKTLDINGFSLAYTETGPKDGPVVFCVHGLLSNSRVFDFLAIELAKSGYRTIAIDLPGRGKSQHFADHNLYAAPNYVPYCLALIAHTTNGAPFTWLGVSLGGILGMVCHAIEGFQMTRFICVDIGPEIPKQGMTAIEKLAKASSTFNSKNDAIIALKTRCNNWGIEDDTIWDHLITHNIIACDNDKTYRFNIDDGIGKALNPNADPVDLWELWEDIKQSTLLIRGGLSGLLPQTTAKAMSERYQGASFHEIVYEKCGHAPNLMQEDHTKDVADWLKASNEEQKT